MLAATQNFYMMKNLLRKVEITQFHIPNQDHVWEKKGENLSMLKEEI